MRNEIHVVGAGKRRNDGMTSKKIWNFRDFLVLVSAFVFVAAMLFI